MMVVDVTWRHNTPYQDDGSGPYQKFTMQPSNVAKQCFVPLTCFMFSTAIASCWKLKLPSFASYLLKPMQHADNYAGTAVKVRV